MYVILLEDDVELDVMAGESPLDDRALGTRFIL
jgi:hypothetical protein